MVWETAFKRAICVICIRLTVWFIIMWSVDLLISFVSTPRKVIHQFRTIFPWPFCRSSDLQTLLTRLRKSRFRRLIYWSFNIVVVWTREVHVNSRSYYDNVATRDRWKAWLNRIFESSSHRSSSLCFPIDATIEQSKSSSITSARTIRRT